MGIESQWSQLIKEASDSSGRWNQLFVVVVVVDDDDDDDNDELTTTTTTYFQLPLTSSLLSIPQRNTDLVSSSGTAYKPNPYCFLAMLAISQNVTYCSAETRR